MLMLSGLGLAAGAISGLGAGLGSVLTPEQAYAQAAPASTLRTVLDRKKLIVGTGSTNAPWHFEDEKGQLVGMDIAMAHILAQGLFDDVTKLEYVKQDPAARIPNLTTGKVDIVIQFMTVTAQRAQLVAFSRPYYLEGVALLTSTTGKLKTYKQLQAAGKAARVSILQNVYAEPAVHAGLPQAQVMQLDTQANAIQALDSHRVDAAAIDLSTVRWLVKRNPNAYLDAGQSWWPQIYSAAVRQGDQDWLNWVNTAFTVAMFATEGDLYDKGLEDYFGLKPPVRKPGFPPI
jgi:polar amino acid transport system substrate-binding protein